MRGRLVDPKTGLPQQVQIADHQRLAFVADSGLRLVTAPRAAAARGEIEFDLERMGPLMLFVLSNPHFLGQIDFDFCGNAVHDALSVIARPERPGAASSRKQPSKPAFTKSDTQKRTSQKV
jgi:hypothetical protein